jgi:hypothetical protein
MKLALIDLGTASVETRQPVVPPQRDGVIPKFAG